MTIIQKAILFAFEKHFNQKDDSGEPYFFHVLSVAKILENITHDQDLIAAAYLHDTIEDTDATYEDIKKNFGKKIADLVYEVTKEGTKTKGYYFPRLHTREGIMLKFADRLSNLSRMEPWDEDRRTHYLKKSKFWKSEEVK
jgi:(p)ppGpp synthase/HD superfamily hydrolase